MITQDILKSHIKYEPDTGKFYYLIDKPKAVKGSEAGKSTNHGYKRIMINNKRYFAHKLAWLYIYGYFPIERIDHINGDTKDNRIENLRLATHSQNMQNSKIPVTNKSGYKGVSWYKNYNKWIAQISVNNKKINLGYFENVVDAANAYVQAAKKYHGEFARI